MPGSVSFDGRQPIPDAQSPAMGRASPNADTSGGLLRPAADAAAVAQGVGDTSTSLYKTGTIKQRPFAPETKYTTSPWVPKIASGFIQRYDTVARKPTGEKVNFLFNPNKIDVSYQVNPSARNIAAQNPVGNEGGYGGPSFVGISFELLFDRSFEVAYHHDGEGARHDVNCLENLLGVSQENPYLTEGNVQKFVLGSPLTFYGWVQSMSVEYMYFNQDMIPMRAGVSISANLFPVSNPVQEKLTHITPPRKPPAPVRRSVRAKTVKGRR